MSRPFEIISITDFVTLIQRGKKLFIIDVRTADEVNNEYYPGCINLPLQEINVSNFKIPEVENRCIDSDSIYLLCGTGFRAQKAAELLRETIACPLMVIDGGIKAMKQAGVRLNKGSNSVISLERQVRIAAGSLVILSTGLGAFVNPLFYGLSAFLGAGLVFSGITNTCGMGMALAHMPWNRTEKRS